MNDTERLEAIGTYGLCVATHDTLQQAGWERTWVCQYAVKDEVRVVMGPTIRKAIDAAVLDIETTGGLRH